MNKETYNNKLAYNNAYNKRKYKAYTFRLDQIRDADLIALLDELDTVQFIRNALKDFIRQHELAQNLKSRKSKRLGMPYEVYSITPDGFREMIGSAENLDNAKDMRDSAADLYAGYDGMNIPDFIIVKRYMNKYGTVVAMKVTA